MEAWSSNMLAPADPVVFFVVVLVLQVIGVASMLLARMPHTTSLHTCSWNVFLFCLLLVGCATIYAMGSQSDSWAWYGTTFSLMAVGGSADLGSASRMAGF
jgi:hypothetical protein